MLVFKLIADEPPVPIDHELTDIVRLPALAGGAVVDVLVLENV